MEFQDLFSFWNLFLLEQKHPFLSILMLQYIGFHFAFGLCPPPLLPSYLRLCSLDSLTRGIRERRKRRPGRDRKIRMMQDAAAQDQVMYSKWVPIWQIVWPAERSPSGYWAWGKEKSLMAEHNASDREIEARDWHYFGTHSTVFDIRILETINQYHTSARKDLLFCYVTCRHSCRFGKLWDMSSPSARRRMIGSDGMHWFDGNIRNRLTAPAGSMQHKERDAHDLHDLLRRFWSFQSKFSANSCRILKPYSGT